VGDLTKGIDHHEMDGNHGRLANQFSREFIKKARGKILPPSPGLVLPPMVAFLRIFLADYKTSMNLLYSDIFII
jgi:hypothetical protein